MPVFDVKITVLEALKRRLMEYRERENMARTEDRKRSNETEAS